MFVLIVSSSLLLRFLSNSVVSQLLDVRMPFFLKVEVVKLLVDSLEQRFLFCIIKLLRNTD